MKRNAIIIIVLGLVIICAVVLVAMNQPSHGPAYGPGPADGNRTAVATPPPVPKQVKTDLLEKFDLLKAKIGAAGQSFGGSAVQLVEGDETAMVYIYKPPVQKDISDLLATGFAAVYDVFETKDPLLVGIVDTSQMISSQQYKVDLYALERPVVAEYLKGNMTRTELAGRALIVTPQTESLRPNNTSRVKKSVDVALSRPGSFSQPVDRISFFVESLNQSGYMRPLSLQTGDLPTGGKAVNVVMYMKRNASMADKYHEIDALLRACAGSYGDHDRFLVTLLPMPEDVSDYYMLDTASEPVLRYLDGDISQYQLYNAMNLTYYTK